jgi:lysozyme family protein
MFVDAVSALADLKITAFAVVNGANAGIQQTFPAAGLPALVTVATFGADAVSFTSTARFLVSVADAAGNVGSAYLTIPIVAAPVVSLVVADARQSYTTALSTGSTTALTSGRLVLTVIASCSSPMIGFTASSLAVTGGAAPWARSVAASNNGYTWTFQFTVNVTQGVTYAMSVARGQASRVSDGVANLAGNAISATIGKYPGDHAANDHI